MSASSTSSSWQASLLKLASLIILLPFASTYLYLQYYTFWQNEYCIVGPTASLLFSHGGNNNYNYNSINHAEGIVGGDVIDNELKGITTSSSSASSSSSNTNTNNAHYGIYIPQQSNKKNNNTKKRKRGNNNNNNNTNNTNDGDRRTWRQAHASSKRATAMNNDESSLFSRAHWWWGSSSEGWPSITQSAIMISAPYSQLSKYRRISEHLHWNTNHDIAIEESHNDQFRWCLQSTSNTATATATLLEKWCSDPIPNSDASLSMYPPSGKWKQYDSTSSQQQLQQQQPTISISCPAPATITSKNNKSNKNKKHKQQNAKQNKNLTFILQKPTTTLLLLLNIYLAFQYWNNRTNPSSIAKSYTRIVNHHEWWRSFTGATAHFEPMHIGFNMMSLHSLGRELEGVNGFHSIVFLVYNIAMVVMTTAVMMGMVYGRLKFLQHRSVDHHSSSQEQQQQQQRLRETSAVGYSAVLFAWMVITTLERNQPTCPIPFFNDVCFSTYTFPGLPFLKFNLSPIVQLVMAQFIMPRVSFMGHLAGILCGFGLHWGWGMPPLEVCSPNVLIGGVHLLGCLWWRRRVVPVRPLLRSISSDEEGTSGDNNDDVFDGGNGEWRTLLMEREMSELSLSSHSPIVGHELGNGGAAEEIIDPFTRSKQKKKERELDEVRRKQKTLLSIRNLIGVITIASLYAFDWTGSLVLSQCILLAYFIFGTRSSLIIWTYSHCTKVGNDIIDPEKQRSGMIWRGFLMASTLAIVVDSMSMASFVVMRNFIAAERNFLRGGLIPVILFMTLRMTINLLGLTLSSKVLHDMGQVGGGIFFRTFSFVISWSKLIGDGIFLSQKPLWTAFEGRGIRLGGGQILARMHQSQAL